MRATGRSGDAGCHQRRALLDGAVAVDAVDFDGIARLAVELAVAVTVLLEVAVDAVHALLQMNVFQMHGLAELVGIVWTQ